MDPNQIVMAVRNDLLFNNDEFEGFSPMSGPDFKSRILEHHNYMKRGIVEYDFTRKQPIGYMVIVNPSLKKVFSFQRSKKKSQYDEKRLLGAWSWGVGGHVERQDDESANSNIEDSVTNNPIDNSRLRELEEEVTFVDGTVNVPKHMGYINSNANDVSKVHIGLLYIAETDATIVKPKDNEILKGELRTVQELEATCLARNMEVEVWSEIALEPIKEYFNNL